MASYNNPFAANRIRNIFGPVQDVGVRLPKRFVSGQTNTFNPQQKPTEDEPDDAMSYYQDLEKMRSQLKASPARSAYMEAINQQPTEEETRPSRGRRIGAAIAGGLGGLAEGPTRGAAMAQHIIDAPYKTAMRDYSTRVAGLGESAKLEQEDIESQMHNLEVARKMGLDYNKFRAERFDKDRSYNLDRDKLGEDVRFHTGTMKNTSEANANTKWYRGKQLGIQEYNALTTRAKAEADVETAGRMAGAAERRAGALETAAGNRQPSATQQRSAVDNALRDLYRDPRFSQFVEKDETTGLYDYADAKPGWDKSMMYKEFQKRMRQALQGAKKTGISLFEEDDQDEDDDSIIIGSPIPFRR